MLLKNNLKKYKEAPEAIKQMVGLVSLTTLIIFTFIFLNIYCKIFLITILIFW